ncbi:MAG TPA: VOC family protein, partial [Anaerolineales bacterium]
MKPRVTTITIGVDDLDRSLRFYRDGLGFPTRGIIGTTMNREFPCKTVNESCCRRFYRTTRRGMLMSSIVTWTLLCV